MRRTLLFLLAIVYLAAKPASTNAEELSYEDYAIEASQDTAISNIDINETNFPDANFRNWLLSQSYGKDGKLTENEIKNITSIDVKKKNISTLKGIEYFTSLKYLSCNSNQLTFLDVSKNTALESLYCSYNQLTSLDVSQNTALKSLNCYSNQLTFLDVSKNTELAGLHCYSNQLTSLDVSKNTALTTLDCGDNKLTSLDVSKNTALEDLLCYSNQLTSLDVSQNTALTTLDCSSNQLTSLDVSQNTALDWLFCYSNQLTSLDISNNTALHWLQCHRNQINGNAMDDLISSLPYNSTNYIYSLYLISPVDVDEGNACSKSQVSAVRAKRWTPLYWDGSRWYEYEGSENPNAIVITSTNFPDANFRNWILEQDYGKDGKLTEYEINNVTTIAVYEKNISTLEGIEYFTNLRNLYCYSNQLTSLDVSTNTKLKWLYCYSNQLTSLDVSKNTALEDLRCYSNQLTSLDVSNNTALFLLYCYSNQLTSLDVSNNTALSWLYCHSNQLTSLDVSKNTALEYFSCNSNQLTSIDLSKNTALLFISCFDNKIRGTNMDNLISSLPQKKSGDNKFYVISNEDGNDGNVCTKTQVAVVKAKGWTPLYWDGSSSLEYEGSDDYQYAQGDVNGDGDIGIGDIITITNVMASNETNADAIRRADVNGDGEVGIGDIISITNIMAGQ